MFYGIQIGVLVTRLSGSGYDASGSYNWSGMAYTKDPETFVTPFGGGYWAISNQAFAIGGPPSSGGTSNPSGIYSGSDNLGPAVYEVSIPVFSPDTSQTFNSQILKRPSGLSGTTPAIPPAIELESGLGLIELESGTGVILLE